jgi:hypothetical protein
MIRSFDWRDMGLIKALGPQGVCLDTETCLIHGTHPLQDALLAYLMPGTGAPTLVWRNNGSGVFAQLRHRFGDDQARVLLIAPGYSPALEGWTQVIERLAVEAGGRGALNLIAEASEDSPEFEALRLAGFAVYARQSLWMLSGPLPEAQHDAPLAPVSAHDAIAISTLYANIVPRLVQQVESLPNHRRGYVLKRDDELIAFLDVRRGSLGIWTEPYLHPEAYDLSEAVLHTCLRLIPNRNERPVYVCVRRYQDWLQEILAHSGFQPVGAQAVMVKRLVKRVTEPLKPLPATVEGKVPTTPTPIVRARIVKDKQENFSARPANLKSGGAKTTYAKTNHGRPSRFDGSDPRAYWRGPDRRQPHRRPA